MILECVSFILNCLPIPKMMHFSLPKKAGFQTNVIQEVYEKVQCGLVGVLVPADSHGFSFRGVRPGSQGWCGSWAHAFLLRPLRRRLPPAHGLHGPPQQCRICYEGMEGEWDFSNNGTMRCSGRSKNVKDVVFPCISEHFPG